MWFDSALNSPLMSNLKLVLLSTPESERRSEECCEGVAKEGDGCHGKLRLVFCLLQTLGMDLRAWLASKCGIAEGHAQELAAAFASDYWIENSTELSARHSVDPCIVDNLSAPGVIKVAIRNALNVADGAGANAGSQPVKRTSSPLHVREQYETRRNGVHVPVVTPTKKQRTNNIPQPTTEPMVEIQRALQKKGYGEQMNALVLLHGIFKRGKRFCTSHTCSVAHIYTSNLQKWATTR
jgi:hypothetical protein